MAVGRISGPLLKANLERNGIDLAFETDLLYLDVTNSRIGINTATPQYDLDVDGTVKSTRQIADVSATIGDIELIGNTIRSTNGNLNLGTLDNVVYQNKARIDSIDIEGNLISTNESNANLEISPNGTGTVEVQSDMNVTGNIHATGNISADGNITLGDADTDSITFNAKVASNIIPDATNTYTLGESGTGWNEVFVNQITATSVTTDSAVIDGVDLTLRQGNIFYVAENGDDTFTGTHQQDPFASLKHALSQASAGDTIYLFPGVYTEVFPLTVPAGVSVQGGGIRSVKIVPTTATRYNDCFLLNGESTVEDLTIADYYSGRNNFTITSGGGASGTFTVNVGTTDQAHTYVSGGRITNDAKTIDIAVTGATYVHGTGVLTVTYSGTAPANGEEVYLGGLVFSCNGTNRTFPDNGYGFRFATDFEVTSRSPYIKNITAITKGSVTTAEDPRGFNEGDAGKGALIDGAYATANSKEASMLFHSATFIVPGVDAISCTNGVRVEWLNSFTYFANRSFHCFNSNAGKAYNGKTKVRLGGITGTFTQGNTITFTSVDNSTIVTATIDSVNRDVMKIDGIYDDVDGFDTTPASIIDGSATATEILSVDKREFGAEIRMIGSASVYGNFGLVGDGSGVIIYAIGHNLAYIGNGKEVTNDPNTVNQANEIVELNNAKVRYNSVDHRGDFRVGDLFYVDQESGSVSFVASNLNIDITNGVTFTTGSDTTFINGNSIRTGNVRISGQTIETTSGDLILDSATNDVTISANVDINGNLDVSGNVTVGGNITLGDADTDNIEITARIDSDLIPNVTDTYNLGSDTKIWNNLYVNQVEVDDIEINTNYITTTSSNADLELRANGTGEILVPNNNVEITNDLTVSGTTTLANTNITGTLTHVGDFTQTGNTTVNGNVTVTGNLDVDGRVDFESIRIEDNFITTTDSNADLELRANGSGEVVIPNNNLRVDNDVTVTGAISAATINASGSITANQWFVGDIFIDDNFITTNSSNADLDLRANGTGKVLAEGLEFDSNSIATTTGDLNFDAESELVVFDNTGAVQLPKGTTAERPTAVAGQIRYNTDNNVFEGFNGTHWINVTGVQDLDGDTKITAELTPGANDNTIRFDIAGTTVVDITDQRLNAHKVVVDDITIDGNVISTSTTDTDLQLSANGTGKVRFDNLGFKDNILSNEVDDAVTLFESSANGYVKFDGTYGLVIPVGTSLDRPGASYTETGMMRFNTADERVEVYDGSQWAGVAGASAGINANDADSIAIVSAIIFG